MAQAGSLRLLSKPHVREALHWELVEGREGYVHCYLCARHCIIAPGRYGACGVRKNVDGKLYTLVYGLLSAVHVDPIEKKPLLHFLPGARVLSISTVGCNFFCQFCQNFEISQSRLERGLYGRLLRPEEVVELAESYGADGITYTYNEPTIFYEFMLEVARLAHRRGLVNTMVTNGYMTPPVIREFSRYLDAATVDLKGGGNPEFYRKIMFVPDPSPIYEAMKAYKDNGVFVEVTNLVVPRLGDREEDVRKLARWIVENLGPETPFHLLRFHPDYKLIDVPHTPVKTLERLAQVAKEQGLHYVYIGNVWGHPLENTRCPQCDSLLIRRYGFYVEEINLTPDSRCPTCGAKQNIVIEHRGRRSPAAESAGIWSRAGGDSG